MAGNDCDILRTGLDDCVVLAVVMMGVAVVGVVSNIVVIELPYIAYTQS